MSSDEHSGFEKSDEQAGLKTIYEWGPEISSMTVEVLQRQVSDGFLVGCGGSMLKTPSGPAETLMLSRELVAAAGRGETVILSPVFPLRRRENSEFSFMSVGRTGNCDIAIPDESISKLHAIIRQKGELFLVHDAGSRNGSFLQGRKISKERTEASTLHPGDGVRFGSVDLIFLSAAEFHFMVTHQLAALNNERAS